MSFILAVHAPIAGLALEIAILKREKDGHSAERTARSIDQLELWLEDLETGASEAAIRAEKTTKVAAFERRQPVRKPFSARRCRADGASGL